MFTSDARTQCTLDRLMYVDDSGAEDTGFIVYGWVQVRPSRWAEGLQSWLELRRRLARDFAVPVSQELHATKFVNGRSEISTDPPPRFLQGGAIDWKGLGHEVMVECLSTIGRCPAFEVGAAFHHTSHRKARYAEEKFATYTGLVHHVDRELAVRRSLGAIVMDGGDPHYRDSHRTLDLSTRHLIEDPFSHDSAVSQWTQVADLVAYAAYWSLVRPESKSFGWQWYSDYLSHRDPRGTPFRIAPQRR